MAQSLKVVKQLAWFGGLLCSLVATHAQDSAAGQAVVPSNKETAAVLEPMSADRPGFSNGVDVLASGILQLEGGFSLSGRTEGASVDRSFIGGSPLIRLGIGHRTELRFGGDGVRLDSHRSGEVRERARGASDFSVGAKHQLTPERGARPALTLIAAVSLPAGDRSVTSSGVDPTLELSWSKSLRREIVAGGSFSFASLTESGERYSQRAASFQLARRVWRKWQGFWEGYLVAPVSRSGDRAWTFDTGLSIPAGRNAQFDVSIGQQISPFVRCWFVAAGFAVRRPFWFAGR